MTRIFHCEQDECRKARLAEGLAADGPDDAECRSTCQDLAHTERGIDQLRVSPSIVEAAAADLLTPRPLRDPGSRTGQPRSRRR